MKKILIILFLVVFQMANATEKDSLYQANRFQKYFLALEEDDDFECDACGCSAVGGSMGFSSMLNNNFIGLRYVYQQYSSKQGVFKNSPWVKENFNSVQIWGRIPVSEKIQMTLLVPYNFNSQELPAGTQNISGVGDITVMGLYSLYNTEIDSATVYSHKVQVGGGVKAPTGTYNTTTNGTLNPSFQLGTGSWDFLVVSEYVFKRKEFGVNTALSYIIKTENQKQYQYGNQFNYGSTMFYLFDLDAVKLVPLAGIAGEVYASNKQVGQEVLGTKGDIFFGKFGMEMSRNKFSFGINTMLPINQNLTGGNVKSEYRMAVNLNYQL